MSLQAEFYSAAVEIFDAFGDLVKVGQILKKGASSFDRDKGTNVRKEDTAYSAKYVPDKPSKNFVSRMGTSSSEFKCYLILADLGSPAPVSGDQLQVSDDLKYLIDSVETDDAEAGIYYKIYIKV